MYNLLHERELDNNIENPPFNLSKLTVENYLNDVLYFYLKDVFCPKEIEEMAIKIVKDIIQSQKGTEKDKKVRKNIDHHHSGEMEEKIDIKRFIDYFDKVSFL